MKQNNLLKLTVSLCSFLNLFFREMNCTTRLSQSNWNLECWFLCREENRRTRGKPREQGENQQQTQPTCGTGPESNPGHIGGRRAPSPLRHSCSPKQHFRSLTSSLRSEPLVYFIFHFCTLNAFNEGTLYQNILV